MPAGRARVLRIDVAIDEAVERHRGTAGEDHAQEDAGQLDPGETLLLAVPGKHGAEQRERQREHGVAEAHHFEEVTETTARVHDALGCYGTTRDAGYCTANRRIGGGITRLLSTACPSIMAGIRLG